MVKYYGILILLCMTLFPNLLHAESSMKKIFIHNINASSGVQDALAKKATDYISLSIFEKYKTRYHLVTDDDIKVMSAEYELKMAAGFDSENSLLDFAKDMKANEIIYGTLSRNGSKLNLTMQNIRRNDSTQELSRKSNVSLNFYESQLEWYSKEIALKLINPNYSIREASTTIDDSQNFVVGKIYLNEIKKISIQKDISAFGSISKKSFQSKHITDELFGKILEHAMQRTEEGDIHYQKGLYKEALDIYSDIIMKADMSLRPESKKQMTKLLKSVNERKIAALKALIKTEYFDKGDSLYANNNIKQARVSYLAIPEVINKNASPSDISRFNQILDESTERVSITYGAEYKARIEDVDEDIRDNDKITVHVLAEGNTSYKNIQNDFNALPWHITSRITKIKDTLSDRLLSLNIAWATIYLRDGDRYYGDYKFSRAITAYRRCNMVLTDYGISNKKTVPITREANKKIDIVEQTGKSWLENQVKSACGNAEYLSFKGRKNDAHDVLEKTGYMIGANNNFSTRNIVTMYNETSRTLHFDNESINDNVKTFYDNKKNHYGTASLAFLGITAAAIGGGYFLNTKVVSLNSEYDDLSAEYKTTKDAARLAELKTEMEEKSQDSDKYARFRNISYGIGAATALISTYYLYKFFSYRSIARKMKEQYTNNSIVTPFIIVGSTNNNYNGISYNLSHNQNSYYGMGLIYKY